MLSKTMKVATTSLVALGLSASALAKAGVSVSIDKTGELQKLERTEIFSATARNVETTRFGVDYQPLAEIPVAVGGSVSLVQADKRNFDLSSEASFGTDHTAKKDAKKDAKEEATLSQNEAVKSAQGHWGMREAVKVSAWIPEAVTGEWSSIIKPMVTVAWSWGQEHTTYAVKKDKEEAGTSITELKDLTGSFSGLEAGVYNVSKLNDNLSVKFGYEFGMKTSDRSLEKGANSKVAAKGEVEGKTTAVDLTDAREATTHSFVAGLQYNI